MFAIILEIFLFFSGESVCQEEETIEVMAFDQSLEHDQIKSEDNENILTCNSSKLCSHFRLSLQQI